LNLLKTLLPFDTGGVLQPNSMGINLSNRPEYVFTQSQFKQMEAGAANGTGTGAGSGVHIENLTVADWDEAHREMKKTERRNARQYSGRP
jgi:hypothetical protein